MHKDQFLQFPSLVKANQIDFTNEDIDLVKKFPKLLLKRPSIGMDDLSNEIFSPFSDYEPYEDIARICIAKRIGLTNQIIVMSSNVKGDLPNPMATGYSCFVRKESSLFEIGATSFRIFLEMDQVAQKFAKEGLPIQRSLNRLVQCNLKSGVCLPLFAMDQLWGFLFLNSKSHLFSKPRPVDYTIFSLLQSHIIQNIKSQSVLSRRYYSLTQVNQASYMGERLDHNFLKKCLEEHANYLNHTLNVSMQNHPKILISHGNLANILSRICYKKNCHSIHIEFQEVDTGLDIIVHFDGIEAIEKDSFHLETVKEDAYALEMRLHFETNTLIISTILEYFDTGSKAMYSTDH